MSGEINESQPKGEGAPPTEKSLHVISFGSEISVHGHRRREGRIGRFVVLEVGDLGKNQRSVEAAEIVSKLGEPLSLATPGTNRLYQINKDKIGPKVWGLDEIAEGLRRFTPTFTDAAIEHYKEEAASGRSIDLSKIDVFG